MDNNSDDAYGEQNVPDGWGVQPPVTPAPVPPAPPTAMPPQPGAPPAPVPPNPPVLGRAIGAPPTPAPAPAINPAIPPYPPAAQPALAGDYGSAEPPVAPAAPTGPSKLPWIAAAIGAIMLLGGGGFFALSAFGASGGADSPEAAADEMFDALSNEDFIALGELIEPSERRTIVEPTLTQLLPELSRLGLLQDGVDGSDLEGVELDFNNMTYRVEPIADHPDLAHVFMTGGEFASELNSEDFPLGDAFREQFGDELVDEERTVQQVSDNETPLTFVLRDGRWYFSGLFTVAEAARLDAGERLPLASEAPPTLGSDSPEAAVEALMGELVELDLAGVIGRMDPDEMAALYRYSPLFLEDGQSELDELNQMLRDENVTWNLSDFDFDVVADGDDAAVTVRGFSLDVNTPDMEVAITYGREAVSATVVADELGGSGSIEGTTTRWVIEAVVDGEAVNGEIIIDPDALSVSASGQAAGDLASGELTIDPDGICSRYSVTVSGETESGCVEVDAGQDIDSVLGFYANMFADWPTEFPGFTMQARRTDGEWYVSPIGSVFDGYLEVLGQFEDGQMAELVESAGSLDGLQSDLNRTLEDALFGGGIADDEFVTDDDLFGDELTDEEFAELFGDDFFEGDEFFDDDSFTDEPTELGSINFAALDSGGVFSINDSLSENEYNSYNFELEAGDTLVITAERGDLSDLDTTLTVLFGGESGGQDGDEVAYNDDADVSGLGSSLDSQIELTVSESGSYDVQVSSFAGGSAGEYDLTVARN